MVGQSRGIVAGNRTSVEREPQSVEDHSGSLRRLVLLNGDEHSDVADVLSEYVRIEPRKRDIHVDLERFAAKNPGRTVAAEWNGPLGWTRFMTCRK